MDARKNQWNNPSITHFWRFNTHKMDKWKRSIIISNLLLSIGFIWTSSLVISINIDGLPETVTVNLNFISKSLFQSTIPYCKSLRNKLKDLGECLYRWHDWRCTEPSAPIPNRILLMLTRNYNLNWLFNRQKASRTHRKMFRWRPVPRMAFSLSHGDQSHRQPTSSLTAKMNPLSKAIPCALTTNPSLMYLVLIVSLKNWAILMSAY